MVPPLKTKATIVFLLISLATTASSLSAQEPVKSESSISSSLSEIAITKFQPYGELAEKNEWISNALRQLIHDDLESLNQLSILPLSLHDGMLSSEDMDGLNPNTKANASTIARALEVGVLLIGTYRINGARIKLQALLYHPENNEIISESSTTGMHSSLPELQGRLLHELLKNSSFRIPQAELNRLLQKQDITTDELRNRFGSEAPDRDTNGIKTNREKEYNGEKSADNFEMKSRKQTEFSSLKSTIAEPNMYVGLHYPGLTFGISPSPKASFQIRVSSNSDIQVLDLRGNKHFWISDETNLFFGGSVGLTQFEGEVSEGDGFLLGVHIGTQKFLSEIISFSFDIGPVLVHLQDDDTELTQAGLNFMLNGGVEYHF